jgi:hypothetical protein
LEGPIGPWAYQQAEKHDPSAQPPDFKRQDGQRIAGQIDVN